MHGFERPLGCYRFFSIGILRYLWKNEKVQFVQNFSETKKKFSKTFKKPVFSLVENRLDQTEKQWFRECSPESSDSDKLYYNFFCLVFWEMSALQISKIAIFFEIYDISA
jgi:hypothetical protein